MSPCALLPFSVLLAAAVFITATAAADQPHNVVTTTTTTSSKSKSKSTETIAIKNKLDTAQGKVSDLISRLDSVSDDATRAKNEIHSTLVEVWNIADMLGQDRCADLQAQARADKQALQLQISRLEQQLAAQLKQLDASKSRAAELQRGETRLVAQLAEQRAARDAADAQARSLADKLHWANAVANETHAYQLVAERLSSLLSVVTERSATLQRLEALVVDATAGSADWRAEVQQLSSVIRDAERDFAGGYQNAAVSGLTRRADELQRRLADALQRGDHLASQKGALQKSLDALQTKLKRALPGGAAGGGGGVLSALTRADVDASFGGAPPPPSSVPADGAQTWVGTLTLCILSVCTGAVLVFLLSNWQANKELVDDTPRADKFGFTPSSSATTPGFQRTSVSPLQYVNSANSKTPASRGSTPRRY